MEQALEVVNEKTGEVIEALTAAQIRAQVNRIQEVMKSVMQDGQHFGKIPGCGDKPTLLKPGAEKLMMTFRLVADPLVTDLSTMDEARYRVAVRILTANGAYLGAGIGEASSNEEKYRWRKAVCDEEWNDTPEDRRREKWFRGKEKPYKVKQIRTVPADVANTVLKMAKKRGLIDGILTVTGASDIFTQDIEDLPEEMLDRKAAAPKGAPEQDVTPEQCACGETLAEKTIQYYNEHPNLERLCFACGTRKKGKKPYGKNRPKKDESKEVDFLSSMSDMRAKLGDSEFFLILGRHGVEVPEEITQREKQVEVFKEMEAKLPKEVA